MTFIPFLAVSLAFISRGGRTQDSFARAPGVLDRLPISEPYVRLSGGAFNGPLVPESPDPLVSYRWAKPAAIDALQVFTLPPKAVTADKRPAFSGLGSLCMARADVLVRSPGSIRVDFGIESAAWVEFDSPDCPGDVEMSISEYNEPGIDKTAVPVKHGGTFRLELNPELYDGVRFAWIRIKKVARPWHITAVRAVCQAKPTNYEGRFACSDPKLTRSWYMAAYGVRVALCKDYFGSILMDRGDRMSWTGDAHPAQAAALVAFSNADFIRMNLENTAQQDNGIPSYSLYWVLSLLDYYWYTGDAEYLSKSINNACSKLDRASALFGKDPPLRFYGWDERLGAGFEIWFRPAVEPQNAYRMLSIRAWRDFAAAMGALGREDLQRHYSELAQAKLAEISKTKDWATSFGIHAAADAVNTGLLDEATASNLYVAQFADRVNRLSLSPFNEYFILQALARLGKWDDAIESVRDMWGGMLDYGGTTPFEVYRPSWNPMIGHNVAVPNTQCGIVSLCHPWGAGVVKWLSEGVLGITPTSPGFGRYTIAPHLGGSLTWVSGTTPTPHGPIQASLNIENGQAHIVVPPGTVARFDVPKLGRFIASISVNDKLAWDGHWHSIPSIKDASDIPEAVSFVGIEAGNYNFKIVYRGNQAIVRPKPFVFPARLISRDNKTGGSWGRKYGRDGHILFAQGPGGSNVESLPSYVGSVDFFRAFPNAGRPDSTIWARATSSAGALAANDTNAVPRIASCLSNNDQTMTMTIRSKEHHKYRISLYFLDWEHRGRRQAVELFDANSLRMIAPVALVDRHSQGTYFTYEVDGAVKFRFDKVRGDIVTLSGVFFDPVPDR